MQNNIQNTKFKSKGFTLVELLVVISIISLLSTIVLSSLATARSKARDQYRISTLKQIGNALELYYSANSKYPVTGGSWQLSCSVGSANTPWISDATVGTTWSNNILSVQPHDPRESLSTCVSPYDSAYPLGTPAGFAYWSDNGLRYYLLARLENESSYDIQSENNTWIDGLSLYTTYNWFRNTYVLESRYK